MNASPLPSKQKSFPSLIRWLGTILSLGLLAYLLYKAGLRETWETARQIPAWRLGLTLLLVFVSRLATFARWHTLLSVQDQHISWKDSLRLTFAGLFSSNFLPTTIGGDVVRLAGAVRWNLEGTLAAASLVADRLVGMAGMALMLPFSLGSFLGYTQNAALRSPAGVATMGFWGSLWQKAVDAISDILEKLQAWLHRPVILLRALGWTLLHQLALYLMITVLLGGMNQHLPLTQTAGIWSLTYFISLIPISINGLGLQELTITNLYSLLGGVSASAAINLAIMLRLYFMLGSLPGAIFLPQILAGRQKEQPDGAQ